MKPRFSITILNYNRLESTEKCLNSIIENTPKKNYEIILIDNGSTDDSVYWMKEISKKYNFVKTIFLDKNYGVMKGRNAGFSACKGTYILTLDNDTIFTGDVCAYMSKIFKKYPNCGIVGKCGAFIPDLKKYIHIYHDSIKIPTEVSATTGYCMMLKKEVLESGVTFDEGLNLCQGEDYDFCLQAKKKGFATYMIPNIPLIHSEHGSIQVYLDKYEAIMKHNYNYIFNKWINQAKLIKNNLLEEMLLMLNEENALIMTLKVDKFYFYDYLPKAELSKKHLAEPNTSYVKTLKIQQ